MNRLATVSPNGRSLAPVTASGAHLVMLIDPHSPAAEAYRSLAANLQFAYADRQLQTIGVTSAAEGEGKSTTVANLAVALAQSGRRVIVIDADLRRPGQHTLFGVQREDGLANVLLSDLAQLPLQDTQISGVRVLSSGPSPANPLEALASRRFDQVLSPTRPWWRRASRECCWWSARATPSGTWRVARGNSSHASMPTCSASC